jgi:hypothetical protein
VFCSMHGEAAQRVVDLELYVHRVSGTVLMCWKLSCKLSDEFEVGNRVVGVKIGEGRRML